MSKSPVLSVVLFASLLGAGCASIVNGTTQVVTIDSNVRGAEVAVDGAVVGRTPYTGPIKRGSSTTVRVTNPGYQPKTITLSTEVEPIFWGNIILGGFFGSTTDAGTGAMYKYAPATYELALSAAAPPLAPPTAPAAPAGAPATPPAAPAAAPVPAAPTAVATPGATTPGK
jgi:hypothetical protein